DVAAESFLVLRVGDRRAKHLGDVVGDRLAREPERRERAVDVLAANQIEDEPGLLGRRSHVAGRGVGFDHAAPPPLPPPPGFGAPAAGAGAAPPVAPAGAAAPGAPPGPCVAAAAAAAAARSATRVVWPLKIRVGANSPSLWPTMFSVMY